MIANVSPSSKSYDDTHNTLKYANRAKEIKSSVSIKIILFNNANITDVILWLWIYEFLLNHYIFLFNLAYQLKSNVLSLDSHIGQYAVICEKQRQEVIWNSRHYHAQFKKKIYIFFSHTQNFSF